MPGHFITDVRLEDSNEVLHIPVLKGKVVKKILSGITPKNPLLGGVSAPSADDPLEQFLQHAGCLFGKDPSKWEQVGEPLVDVTEDGSKRRIKKTGTYSGTQLHLWHEPPYCDSRLPVLPDQPHLNFNIKRAEVTTTEEWRALVADQPWTPARRRQLALRYLHAKLAAPGEQLQLEGAQGLLELSISKENHVDLMDADALGVLVARLRSANVEVAKTCAAAVWGLATSAEARQLLLRLGVVDALAAVAKGSLALVVATGFAGDPRGADVNGMYLEEGFCTEKQREELQANVLGALAVLLVDRSCRQPYIELEPDWATLFAMAGWLPGYSKPWATARREAAAKVLSSAMQRDGEARVRMIESGALKAVLALLDQQGPDASLVVQFCMSSLLATLVLDDTAMEMVRNRGEAPLMFRSCLQLTMRAMGAIKQHFAAPPPSARGLMSESGVYVAPGEGREGGPVWEPASAVRMAEAAAQAMWGATHYCLQDNLEVTQEDTIDLGKLGLDCLIIGEVDLGCVCHCVAATLAALSADERCAAYIMSAPESSVIRTVLALVEVEDDPGFSHSGSVRAAACTCLSFLSCHPLGASGDTCLNGPFRMQLLESGAFGALLRAALASNEGDDCDDVIQQTAAVGIMYLATMAGAVDAAELAMYAALMSSNTNVEMVEYLMAGMWILLKNPDNRKVLGGAFAVNPASSKLAASLAEKLQDTIEVADVHEEAMKISRMQNRGPNTAMHTNAEPSRNDVSRNANSITAAGTRLFPGEPSMPADEPAGSNGRLSSNDTSSNGRGSSDGLEGKHASASASNHSVRASLHEEASSRSSALARGKSMVPDLPLGAVGEGFGYLAAHTETLEDKLKAVEHKRKSILYNHLQQQHSMGGAEASEGALIGRPSESHLSGGSSSDSRQLLSLKSIRTMKGVDDRVEKSLANIESNLGEELEDNWGLDTLVRVGETWLERLMELQNPESAADAAPDLPLLKLFEFLTASMCLYVIDEEGAGSSARREADLYTKGAPRGAHSQSWWTIDAPLPTPEPMVNPLLQRTVTILLTVLRIKVPAAWKSMQLSVVMLWNAAAKSASVERHEVDQGVLDALLDITHCTLWPPTLRDMAAGQLQFLMETYANLNLLGVSESCAAALTPGALEVAADSSGTALDKTPHPGLVPFLHAMVSLVAASHPLLELRGARGIARTCYAAPAGATSTSALLAEAKSIAAALGALGVLVGLLKRSAARYLTIYAGGTPPLPPALSVLSEDAYRLYERDFSHLEGVLEVFGAATAALLNLSVLRANQPRLARVGLLTLLSTNTCLYEAISAKADGAVPEEARLLDVMAAIIQNLANHPDNRTRLYKAELRGTAALDKLIEGPVSPEPSDMPASLASPVGGGYGKGTSRSLTSSPVPGGTRAGMLSPGRTGSPRAAATAAATSTVRGSPRKTHISGAAIMSGTPDPAMVASASMRPKAAFGPPAGTICAALAQHDTSGQPTTSGRHQDSPPRSPGLQGRGSGMPPMSPTGYGKGGMYSSPSGMGAQMDSREQFLVWLDSTFLGGGEDGADGRQLDSPNGRCRRNGRRGVDATAGLVDTEPDPCRPGLHRLLCRPLHHLWQDSPEARGRAGKSRWEPPVSEYREGKGAYAVHRNAEKLLLTAAPGEAGSLMAATMQMVGTGRLNMDTASLDRPSTANRSQGRTPMTVLQPREDLIPARLMASMNSSTDPEQQQQQQQHADGMHVSFGGSGSMGGALDLALNDVREAMGQEQEDMPIVSLKVVMAPQRPRTVISFEDKLFPDAAPGNKAVLTIFEHVEGARVSDGLFSEYTLPNGRKAFMYYQGGDVMDEAAVGPVPPPARPTTVPLALQQSMPLGKVLDSIAKPPGTAPPFSASKPVPRLVPLPPVHTLAVKRPDLLDAGAFGNLREDHLQLVLSAEQILKQQTTTYEEDISIVPQEEHDPWTLPMSVFKPRAKESDARAYYDNAGALDKVFERDWQRATAKEKFTSMLGREAKASGNGKSERQALEEIHDVLKKHYQAFISAFTYYASLGGNDPYHMPLNAFTSFLDDCNIPDSESQAIKRSDCDTIFIVCNFQPDKKSAEAAVNDEHALMRYEFMEVFVRAGIAKYIKGGATDDLANAVDMLFGTNILPGVPYLAAIVPNDFRTERLYTEEVDLVLKKHQLLLRALYSRYRLKPSGGGLRPKVLRLDGWLQLLSDARVVDGQFTLQDGTLAFLWSRMVVIDEIKDYARYTSLTFVDFMEALGRVADMKSLPTASDLADSGFPSIMEWALEKERYEGGGGMDGNAENSSMPEIFRPRASCNLDAPKPRPLYAKLELLIELMCRRLHWDPAQPEAPYSMDALLRMVKQIDKNLGP